MARLTRLILPPPLRPTYTLFRLRDAAKTFTLELTFLSSSFADDYARLSRPVYTVQFLFALAGGAKPVRYRRVCVARCWYLHGVGRGLNTPIATCHITAPTMHDS